MTGLSFCIDKGLVTSGSGCGLGIFGVGSECRESGSECRKLRPGSVG
jgi:hypothetical protein